MAYVATLQQTWISGAASLVPTWVDPAVPMVASADDFDSAIGTTSVTNATTTTPDVTITPFNSSEVTGWMMTYTRYTGCNGKTPEFTLDFTGYRGGIALPATPWQMVWRYVDDTDPGTGRPRAWNTFDNGTGDPVHVFSNNTAFSQDAVEVAVKPRWRYLDTQQSIAYAALSSYATELPSAVAFGGDANVFNTVTLTSGADNSVTPTTLNQYGIKLDDTTVSPAIGDKLNFFILTTTHSSEDQGNFAGWELILLYLDGVGTTADWFRQHCRLFVYDVNPAGRYYGAERWTQEQASDEDPNRSWDDTNSEQVNALKSAISTDASRFDILMDFHGAYWLNGNGVSAEFGIFTVAATGPDETWRDRVNVLLSPVSVADLGSDQAGSSQDYFRTALSAQLYLTPEFPIAAPNYPGQSAMYGYVVEAFVDAIDEMVAAGELSLFITITDPVLSAPILTVDGSNATPQVTVTYA